MPVSVRVAAILMALLGALLLLNVAVTWLGRDVLVDRITGGQGGAAAREMVERDLLVNATVYLLVGMMLWISAVALARRRTWGRWNGVVSAGVLLFLTVTTMFSAGGATPTTLFVLVGAVAVLASLLAGTTRQWLGTQRRPE